MLKEFEHIRTLSQIEKEALLIDILSRPFIDLLCDWAFKHVFGHNEKNLMLHGRKAGLPVLKKELRRGLKKARPKSVWPMPGN